MSNTELGKRVQSRRKELRMTQSNLAEIIDISDKFVSDIDNGRSTPSLQTLMNICETLQVSQDYLLLESDDNLNLSLKHRIDQFKDQNHKEIISQLIDVILKQESEE